MLVTFAGVLLISAMVLIRGRPPPTASLPPLVLVERATTVLALPPTTTAAESQNPSRPEGVEAAERINQQMMDQRRLQWERRTLKAEPGTIILNGSP